MGATPGGVSGVFEVEGVVATLADVVFPEERSVDVRSEFMSQRRRGVNEEMAVPFRPCLVVLLTVWRGC